MFSILVASISRAPAFKSPRMVRLYHENIIDHYENPRNVGSLDKKSRNVGTGKNCVVHILPTLLLMIFVFHQVW
jgi:hypothetical protein